MAKQNGKTILLCALIILQFVFLINFWSEHLFNSAMFESDAATEILLAEQCANEGKIIADDWYYSTELRVLHNHLVHTPVYALTGSFRKTYAISDLIIALLISASVFFLLSSAQLSLNGRLLGVLLFLVPYGGWKRYSPFSVFLGADYYSFFYHPFFVDDVRNKAVKPFVIVACPVILAVNDLSLRLSYDCYSPAGEAYIDGGFSALYRDAPPDKRAGYIAYLEQNGYTFGYSTFWQANITTVLTEGRVRLLSVQNNRYFDPFNVLTKRTYTEQREDYPPQFILLTLNEARERLENGFEVYGEEGYRDEMFVVYVR